MLFNLLAILPTNFNAFPSDSLSFIYDMGMGSDSYTKYLRVFANLSVTDAGKYEMVKDLDFYTVYFKSLLEDYPSTTVQRYYASIFLANLAEAAKNPEYAERISHIAKEDVNLLLQHENEYPRLGSLYVNTYVSKLFNISHTNPNRLIQNNSSASSGVNSPASLSWIPLQAHLYEIPKSSYTKHNTQLDPQLGITHQTKPTAHPPQPKNPQFRCKIISYARNCSRSDRSRCLHRLFWSFSGSVLDQKLVALSVCHPLNLVPKVHCDGRAHGGNIFFESLAF